MTREQLGQPRDCFAMAGPRQMMKGMADEMVYKARGGFAEDSYQRRGETGGKVEEGSMIKYCQRGWCADTCALGNIFLLL